MTARTEALLAWYEGVARPLPWRSTRDPYALLVSEVMLQLTQATRVAPYYEAFLARMPPRWPRRPPAPCSPPGADWATTAVRWRSGPPPASWHGRGGPRT